MPLQTVTSFDPEHFQWRNGEPLEWKVEEGALTVTPVGKLDFWRKTFYSPELIKQDGSSYLTAIQGEDEATVYLSFSLTPKSQFDQAGCLVYVDDETWAKCGIEYVDGKPRLSCVVTNGYSDWSTASWPDWDESATSVRMRIHRLKPGLAQGNCLVFEAAPYVIGDTVDSACDWQVVRIASLRHQLDDPKFALGTRPWMVGPYCFAPVDQKGCSATFHHVRVGPKEKLVHSNDASDMESTKPFKPNYVLPKPKVHPDIDPITGYRRWNRNTATEPTGVDEYATPSDAPPVYSEEKPYADAPDDVPADFEIPPGYPFHAKKTWQFLELPGANTLTDVKLPAGATSK